MTDLTTPWETVERAKAGDREAFAEIYRACHPKIVKSAHHRLSRPQDDLGNDVDRADESRFDKPGEELVLTEDVGHLFAAIQRLTPDQREVIKFRYLEELSVADTAAAMQREQGAIKALAFRGMSRLATDLKLREAVR